MSYIGRQRPTETTSSVLRSTHTGDGSTTTFNLPGPVANEISIIATINGVTQQDSAYTTNGSQIIFASAPANGDAIELRTISDVGLSYAPFAGSVTTGILADDAVTTGKIVAGAVTSGKLASGAAVANIGTRAIGVSQVPAGSVIQVVSTTPDLAQVATSSTSFVSSGLSRAITPTSASSKIFVICTYSVAVNSGRACALTLYRNSTNLAPDNALGRAYTQSGGDTWMQQSVMFLDSPSTTSSTTYALYYRAEGSYTVDLFAGSFVAPTLTVMEIAA